MDLGFRSTLEAVNDDWPIDENRQKWRLLWQEGGAEKAHLILRHIVYAKELIEDILGGAQLGMIELVYLRQAVVSSIEACIRFDQLEDEGHPCFDCGIMPLQEIVGQWFLLCMDFPYEYINKIGSQKYRNYRWKLHARRNDEGQLEN